MNDAEQLVENRIDSLERSLDSVRLTPDGLSLWEFPQSRQMLIVDVESGKPVYRLGLDYAPSTSTCRSFESKRRLRLFRAAPAASSSSSTWQAGGARRNLPAAREHSVSPRRALWRWLANYQDRQPAGHRYRHAGVLRNCASDAARKSLLQLRPGTAVCSGSGMDGIAIVFPYRTLEVDQTLLAGHAPGAMACSITPAYLFVASRAGSEISIVDIDSRKVIAVIQAGQMPTISPSRPTSNMRLY